MSPTGQEPGSGGVPHVQEDALQRPTRLGEAASIARTQPSGWAGWRPGVFILKEVQKEPGAHQHFQ